MCSSLFQILGKNVHYSQEPEHSHEVGENEKKGFKRAYHLKRVGYSPSCERAWRWARPRGPALEGREAGGCFASGLHSVAYPRVNLTLPDQRYLLGGQLNVQDEALRAAKPAERCEGGGGGECKCPGQEVEDGTRGNPAGEETPHNDRGKRPIGDGKKSTCSTLLQTKKNRRKKNKAAEKSNSSGEGEERRSLANRRSGGGKSTSPRLQVRGES